MLSKGLRGTAECKQCGEKQPMVAFADLFEGKVIYRKTCTTCREVLQNSTTERKCKLCKSIKCVKEFASKTGAGSCETCLSCRGRISSWKKGNPDKVHASYMANVESNRARASKWYYENKDYALARNKAYVENLIAENPEAWKERQREYQHTWWAKPGNRKKRKAQIASWMRENRDKMNEYYRKWYMANQPALRELYSKRKELYGQSDFSQEDWDSILDFFNYSCAYCLSSNVELTMDHMVPVSKGGAHCKENIVPACRSCNSSKGDRSIFTMLRKTA